MFARWFATARRPARPARRLVVESLEDRSLPAGGVLAGVGAIGDSYTVERGGNNWTSQLGALRGFNFGPAVPVTHQGVTWADYAYVEDGTPQTMLTNGTLARLAGRVAAGDVTLAYLDGVGRDYAQALPAIYHGTLAGAALDGFTAGVLANVRAAIDTLAAAGDVRLVLEYAGPFDVTPFVRENVSNFLGLPPGEAPDPAKLRRYTDAVAAANGRLQALADEYRLPVVDHFALSALAAGPGRQLVVGGYALDYRTPTAAGAVVTVTDPLAMWLDAQHTGPVFQGLKANVVLDAVREAYGADVAPLSDQEILAYAYGQARLTPPPFPATTYYPLGDLVNFNHAPAAGADAAATRLNAAVTVAALANDADPDGDPLAVVAVSAPARGTVVVNADRTITYTPAADFRGGTDTFTYTITDGRFRTATATVTVTVVQAVAIDVRPPAANLGSQGVLPVTLFSSPDFDATRVDVGSIRFAGAAVSHYALGDVNGDGRTDLVLHFRVQDTGLRQLYAQLLLDDRDADGVLDSTRQTATVSLTGRSADGVSFAGDDQIDLFLSGRGSAHCWTNWPPRG